MSKYELTNETEHMFGVKLHRIRALKDFGNVKAGELGGWIETENNLSQFGNAWVYENAVVHEDAVVSGDALVYRNAIVSGNAQVYENAVVHGNAWVSGNAWVYENARVYGNAWVGGNARIYENAVVRGKAIVIGNAWVLKNAVVTGDDDLLLIGPIGSRRAYTTFYLDENRKIYVSCGCFNGSITEFEYKVEQTHGDNKHGKAYKSAIEFAKTVLRSADDD